MPTVPFNAFDNFASNLAGGVHDFTSDATCTLTVALCAVAPAASNGVLADLTQIAYTNLSARVITGVAFGTGLTANDLVLIASGPVAPFRYVVLFDDDPASPADPLIGWYDLGSPVTLAAGDTLTIDFNGPVTVSATLKHTIETVLSVTDASSTGLRTSIAASTGLETSTAATTRISTEVA